MRAQFQQADGSIINLDLQLIDHAVFFFSPARQVIVAPEQGLDRPVHGRFGMAGHQ